MSLQNDSLSEGKLQKGKEMYPDWQVYTCRDVLNVHSLQNLLACCNKERRQSNIGKTSNDAKIITLKLNPSRGSTRRRE